MNDIGGPRMTQTVLEEVFGDKSCRVTTQQQFQSISKGLSVVKAHARAAISINTNKNFATGLHSFFAFLGLGC